MFAFVDATADILFGLSIEQWSEVGIMCGPTILRTLAEQLEMSEDVLGSIYDYIFIRLFDKSSTFLSFS